MVTCWERTDLWTVIFSCVFVTFPHGVLCQVWYLIVLLPEISFFLTLILKIYPETFPEVALHALVVYHLNLYLPDRLVILGEESNYCLVDDNACF